MGIGRSAPERAPVIRTVTQRRLKQVRSPRQLVLTSRQLRRLSAHYAAEPTGVEVRSDVLGGGGSSFRRLPTSRQRLSRHLTKQCRGQVALEPQQQFRS